MSQKESEPKPKYIRKPPVRIYPISKYIEYKPYERITIIHAKIFEPGDESGFLNRYASGLSGKITYRAFPDANHTIPIEIPFVINNHNRKVIGKYYENYVIRYKCLHRSLRDKKTFDRDFKPKTVENDKRETE